MKVCLVAVAALCLSACCVFGGELVDGPELNLKVAARWGGEIPPPGSSAVVDFYVMSEQIGNWDILQLDVPYPVAGEALVDTFRFPYSVPITGEHVTYRYEVDLTVAGVTYTAEDHPDELTCEGGAWWWYFAGRIFCSEEER